MESKPQLIIGMLVLDIQLIVLFVMCWLNILCLMFPLSLFPVLLVINQNLMYSLILLPLIVPLTLFFLYLVMFGGFMIKSLAH